MLLNVKGIQMITKNTNKELVSMQGKTIVIYDRTDGSIMLSSKQVHPRNNEFYIESFMDMNQCLEEIECHINDEERTDDWTQSDWDISSVSCGHKHIKMVKGW